LWGGRLYPISYSTIPLAMAAWKNTEKRQIMSLKEQFRDAE
jgi:hypothetical protein